MSNLRRSDDATDVDPERVSPTVAERGDGDRRTPPAAERLFARLATPWDVQLELLEAARVELEAVLDVAQRAHGCRREAVKVQRTLSLAQADLADLQRRRERAMHQAEKELPPRTRRKRVEEAREEAARRHDASVSTTVRITAARARAAELELLRLREEESRLLEDPLVRQPEMLAWVEDTAAAVAATIERDRGGRHRALEPWTRLRGTDVRLVQQLRRAGFGDVLPGLAFGEGPIHLVAGTRFALVELRLGREGVRVEEQDGEVRLVQVRPDVDLPLGVSDGSARTLLDAASLVGDLVGRRPSTLVVVSNWTKPHEVHGDLVLCGPGNLVDALRERQAVDVPVEHLRMTARTLAARPLPDHEAEPPSALDHLAIDVDAVPEQLPATRNLVVYAQEHRSHVG